jgi:integrase
VGKRRGNREGSIYREGKLWAAALTVRLSDGRVVRLRKRAKTRDAVRAWLHERLADLQRDELVLGSDTPLGIYLDAFLERVPVRPKTRQYYAMVVRCYLQPALGPIALRDLQPEHIEALYAELRSQGLADATIHGAHRVLRRALRLAVQWRLLTRSPMERVESPPAGRPRVAHWMPAQVRAFLEAVRDHRWSSLYAVAAFTGARQGELLGLRWEDVDLERGTVTFRRSLQWVTGQGFVETPAKTPASVRRVHLAPTARAALVAHRDRLLAAGQPLTGYVWSTASGRPVSARNLVRHFRQVAERLGLPPIRFHDLRHTAATLMLLEGVPDRVVAELLGHADPSLTKRVYQHVVPRMTELAVAALERAVTGAAPVAPPIAPPAGSGDDASARPDAE